MQNNKVGNVIRMLRQEHNMTQKQLADKMNISDKTVSKWERGLGCPDISFIPELSDILRVDAQNLLVGDITPNDFVGGNMKNTKYYICPICNNISICTGEAEISCCGKKLTAQTLKKVTENEKLSVQVIEDEWYITSTHPMTKTHYISFIAFVTGDRIHLVKQYPEWNLNVRIPKKGHGMLLSYCTEHGLFYQSYL
ncbi:helix-turn-helix domain-containing protein [Pectinatus sottacetonis]|uniref:helix-turn-helix domain-containing protein n=1 Tax=Pectinatus sottacetonis TaxID=1002795 RepID=UPI0018C4F08A|nr:helix-turn-helix domain-containing protein [Pectinatus sottacetonis]